MKIVKHQDGSYDVADDTKVHLRIPAPITPFQLAEYSSSPRFDSVMIDLESLSTDLNAMVLSLGMVFFSPRHDEEEKIYLTILPESWEAEGLSPDIRLDTIEFWKRPDNINHVPAVGDGMTVRQAMQFFSDACKAKPNLEVYWAKGPDYDYGVLAYWLRALSIDIPFQYWERKDLRTALYMGRHHGVIVPKPPVKHHALLDAETQLKQLRLVL